MEQLLTYFFSLPSFVIYTIFGGVGAALGVLVGSFLSKVFKKEKISWIVIIIFLALSILLPKHILAELKKERELELALAQTMEQLKEQELFSIIFRIHPEAEIEMKEKMRDAINNAPDDQLFLKAQAVPAEIVAKYSAEIIVKYVDTHLIFAPD